MISSFKQNKQKQQQQQQNFTSSPSTSEILICTKEVVMFEIKLNNVSIYLKCENTFRPLKKTVLTKDLPQQS